jgi:hypothetical protein
MSIGADAFEAKGLHETFDPYTPITERISIHQSQCRNCGFTPEDAVSLPKRCPKCRGTHWERFALPGSILQNSERY